MLILALDTSTAQVGVGLGSEKGLLAEVRLVRGRRHAEQLSPAIEYVCAEAGVGLGDLSAVAVGVGPGMFTGLRVGVTTAKLLAHSLGVPLVALPSLEVLAHPLRTAGRPVAAVTDARRGEVYWALYRPAGDRLEPAGGEHLGSPEDLVAAFAGAGDVVAVGEGAQRYRELLEGCGVELAPWLFAYPLPAAMVELAGWRLERGQYGRPHDVVPLYLRASDAEIHWEGGAR